MHTSNPKSSFTRIQDRAVGCWKSMLPAFGIQPSYLTGKHGPCPLCDGGRDRFRFDDRGGNGTWICAKCGAGNGVDLVMRILGVDFLTARRMIMEELPNTTIVPPSVRFIDTERGKRLWQAALPLLGNDPASRYLARRGLRFDDWPNQLRFVPSITYYLDDKSRTDHPAMLAQFVAPDAKSRTYHVTYLDDAGNKADVPSPRKLLPGPVPRGGAVRLAPSAAILGVAEGIETALAAMKLSCIPVWASLTAGELSRFQPPSSVQHLIVFADHDASFTGQLSAFKLAHALRAKQLEVEVRLPPKLGDDWNDIWLDVGKVGAENMRGAE